VSSVEIVHAFFCGYLHTESSGRVSAIGIWGDECLLEGPPGGAVNLAVYFYVRGVVGSHPAKLTVEIPGVPTIPTISTPISGSHKHAHHIGINFGAMPMSESGDAIARLEIDASPPVSREVRLRVSFREIAE
jgi:hypothetical protein